MIVLTLPEPPSSNRYWRHVVLKNRVAVLLSKEAREYRAEVAGAWALSLQKPIGGDVEFTMTWYRGIRSGDLDNRIKQLLDALKTLAFRDDADIVHLHAHRVDDPGRARVEITIAPAVENVATLFAEVAE